MFQNIVLKVFCWVGSKWSFEVHLGRDGCQNRRFVFLWAMGGCQVEGRVGDDSAWMGLGTGLWKTKTKIPFHAWIILIELVWKKVVPTWNSLQVLKSVLLRRNPEGSVIYVLLTKTEVFVSAKKIMWIHQSKSFQFVWDETIKCMVKPLGFTLIIKF